MDIPAIGLHGAYRRSEIVEHCGRHRLDTALAIGSLRALWKGVVVDATRWLDPHTRAAAAQLSLGPRMALVGATAARLYGLTAIEDGRVHVVVPYRCSARGGRGLAVHRADGWENEIVEMDGLQTLPPDRIIADLLCTLPYPRDALALADEALRQAEEDHESLAKRITERIRLRRDPRGTARAAFLLSVASPAAESPPESWVRLRLIELGFPLPEVNWTLRDCRDEAVARIDLAWPALRIAVEYDGYESHRGREAADLARQRDLERRGWIVVRVRIGDLVDVYRFETELRAAFARRGYTW
jgi:hypothetical protein